MVKVHTTVSVDDNLKKLAKEKNLELSTLLEMALKQRLYGVKIKDLPTEILLIKCSKCGKSVDNGFWCEEKGKFFCKDCNLETYKMADNTLSERFSCRSTQDMHEHIAVPGYDNVRMELFNKIKTKTE